LSDWVFYQSLIFLNVYIVLEYFKQHIKKEQSFASSARLFYQVLPIIQLNLQVLRSI
jgi:hypothetical protein